MNVTPSKRAQVVVLKKHSKLTIRAIGSSKINSREESKNGRKW